MENGSCRRPRTAEEARFFAAFSNKGSIRSNDFDFPVLEHFESGGIDLSSDGAGRLNGVVSITHDSGRADRRAFAENIHHDAARVFAASPRITSIPFPRIVRFSCREPMPLDRPPIAMGAGRRPSPRCWLHLCRHIKGLRHVVSLRWLIAHGVYKFAGEVPRLRTECPMTGADDLYGTCTHALHISFLCCMLLLPRRRKKRRWTIFDNLLLVMAACRTLFMCSVNASITRSPGVFPSRRFPFAVTWRRARVFRLPEDSSIARRILRSQC